MAHGIHLAVVSVIYKNSTYVEEEFHDNDDEAEMIENAQSANDDDFDDFDDEDCNLDENFVISLDDFHISESNTDVSHILIAPLLLKVRQIVKIFRKSPTKNDAALQKYVREEFGSEKNLILDSKTRWNSLVLMLQRFYELRSCVQKALIDIESNLYFLDSEFKILSEVISVLLPIKLTVESLCRQDSNLLTADAAFDFLFSNLELQNNNFSREIKTALLFRFSQRRTTMSSLLKYLHNRKNIETMRIDIFPRLTRSEILSELMTILKKQTNTYDDNSCNENESDVDCVDVEDPPNVTACLEPEKLKTMLQCAIDKQLLAPKSRENKRTNNLAVKLRRELRSFMKMMVYVDQI